MNETKLAHYEIREQIGAGGMGEVYRVTCHIILKLGVTEVYESDTRGYRSTA